MKKELAVKQSVLPES